MDCANGSLSQIAPKIFGKLGLNFIKYACEPNGKNINKNCGATFSNRLSKLTLSTDSAVGISFDGDADRVLFSDENGDIVHAGDRGVHALQISDNQRISTSLDGADVFLRVPGDETIETVFSSLDTMIASLERGEMEDADIDNVNKALEHFSLQQTKLGSQMNRAELQRGVNEKRLLLINEDISNLEDADIAKLVTDLQAKLVSRNAAQQTFIKIAQDNLFNYIR